MRLVAVTQGLSWPQPARERFSELVVRGAEMPRSSEREFGRRVEIDKSFGLSLAHEFVIDFAS